MDYSLYDKVLLKYMISFSIIALILVVIAIICAVYAFRHLDKEAKIVMSIILSIFFIVVFCICFKYFPKYIYDIKNNAYITYTGDFTVSDNEYAKDSSFVCIDNDIQLESYSGMTPGNYTGTVIYSERSLVVFDVKITGTKDTGR